MGLIAPKVPSRGGATERIRPTPAESAAPIVLYVLRLNRGEDGRGPDGGRMLLRLTLQPLALIPQTEINSCPFVSTCWRFIGVRGENSLFSSFPSVEMDGPGLRSVAAKFGSHGTRPSEIRVHSQSSILVLGRSATSGD